MKKIIASLIVLLFVITGYSQEDSLAYKQEDINLFSGRKNPIKVQLYASFDFGYQQLNDDNFLENQSITVGLRVGAVLNKHIVFGVYGFTNSDNCYNDYINAWLRYGNGGLFIEPRILRKLPIHITLPVKAGFGSISYAENDWRYYPTDDPEDDLSDLFFMVEPGAEVEFNIVRYFKISGGVSYKFTDPIKLYATPENILEGWTFNFSLKIIY